MFSPVNWNKPFSPHVSSKGLFHTIERMLSTNDTTEWLSLTEGHRFDWIFVPLCYDLEVFRDTPSAAYLCVSHASYLVFFSTEEVGPLVYLLHDQGSCCQQHNRITGSKVTKVGLARMLLYHLPKLIVTFNLRSLKGPDDRIRIYWNSFNITLFAFHSTDWVYKL